MRMESLGEKKAETVREAEQPLERQPATLSGIELRAPAGELEEEELEESVEQPIDLYASIG